MYTVLIIFLTIISIPFIILIGYKLFWYFIGKQMDKTHDE